MCLDLCDMLLVSKLVSSIPSAAAASDACCRQTSTLAFAQPLRGVLCSADCQKQLCVPGKVLCKQAAGQQQGRPVQATGCAPKEQPCRHQSGLHCEDQSYAPGHQHRRRCHLRCSGSKCGLHCSHGQLRRPRQATSTPRMQCMHILPSFYRMPGLLNTSVCVLEHRSIASDPQCCLQF